MKNDRALSQLDFRIEKPKPRKSSPLSSHFPGHYVASNTPVRLPEASTAKIRPLANESAVLHLRRKHPRLANLLQNRCLETGGGYFPDPMKKLVLALLLPALASAQSVTYPPDSGVLNVRDARYGAKGDGRTDDTAAFQKAIAEGLFNHGVVYIPDGTYLVSDTLKWNNGDKTEIGGWGPFCQIQGQSREKTVIRLKDSSKGFTDIKSPKPVIATGSSGSHGNKKYKNGEGNEAFENHLRNFTVDVGKTNPGAIGIDYQGSNVSALRSVNIKGNGWCGLSLLRRDNGPALVKDLSIEGFQFGIQASQDLCHFTLENIQLRGQKQAGITIHDAVFAIRKLSSDNSVPAIRVSGVALVNLFDSTLNGISKGAAIEIEGSDPKVFLTRLKTSGYKGSVEWKGELITSPNINEWLNAETSGTQGPLAKSLALEVRDTPDFYEEDITTWADAGKPSGKDDTAAIQAALDSGKTTIWFRHAAYRVTKPLVVPPTVKRIQGIGSSLDFITTDPEQSLFYLTKGSSADLTIIDRFTLNCHHAFVARHADSRTLVLQDLLIFDGIAYRNEKDSGPVFIEDLTASVHIDHPTHFWGRQVNLESLGSPKFINRGGTVWALGWKCEGEAILAENTDGGKMELWGGLAYTFGIDKDLPMFVNRDSDFVANFAGMSYTPGANPFYDLIVKDTAQEFRRSALQSRGGGAMLPLYVSSRQSTGERETSLSTLKPTTPTSENGVHLLPESFTGTKPGTADGNPYLQNGKPVWRIDQIWPDDILTAANYSPMSWTPDGWTGFAQKFGASVAKIESRKATIGLRSAWGPDGQEAGSKLGALVFIAPTDGTYTLTATARATYWKGENGVTLEILQRRGDKIIPLKSVPLPKDQPIPLTNIRSKLQANDELILTAKIAPWYTGISLNITDLKIVTK